MPPLFRVDVGSRCSTRSTTRKKRLLLEKIEREKIKGAVNVTRFKGLEMNPQLREWNIHPDTRCLVQLTVDDGGGETHALMDMLLAKKSRANRKARLEQKGDPATPEVRARPGFASPSPPTAASDALSRSASRWR